MARPTGSVTFLFTDIEGSTRRWEADPDAMRAALTAHDDLLTATIAAHNGWLFKHTGDGMCAAFASPADAIAAAVSAQRDLELPVRMGMATGEAEARGDDYFGLPLNRAARVMSAGHGGQILVAESARADLEGVELLDLGCRHLRDLAEPIRIFQVGAAGLATDFPALKTADPELGNLPAQATSFVGRREEVSTLIELVGRHRMITLTGVGGVGKTRLSLELAGALAEGFPDGVWFIELAPVGDPSAVPDVVATTLGITPQSGVPVAESIAVTLAARRTLLVFDNCEHVLDVAADLIATIVRSTSEVVIVASSREALRIEAEHAWAVPPLDVQAGIASTAVSLFVDRATAARHDFVLDDPADIDAVTEICDRLDGIALAIELAAARMVSMSPAEVRDRLDDRFRLLSGGRRRLEHHQTLRQAVQWSYDLLDDSERSVLERCSVFADGFDLAAAHAVSADAVDEYSLMDDLESLVRKSLILADSTGGRTRFRMLETIRQFGETNLVKAERSAEVHRRHAAYFAAQTEHQWQVWDSPDQLDALAWADEEFANLRAAFRWATDQGDLATATTIAAHVAIIVWPLQWFEPVGWAEEILPGAVAADLAQLPRLYVAASLCLYSGRPDLGVEYAQAAARLEAGAEHDPFEDGWSGVLEALAHLFGGRIERRVEICTELAERDGFARVVGMCGLTWALPAVGRVDEAMAIADETIDVARGFGNPFWIGWALGGYGRAHASTEPVRALEKLREGLRYAAEHRLPFWQANLAQDAAKLEGAHGDVDDALTLFASAIDAFHRAGNVVFLAATLASLAVFLQATGRSDRAAIIYGASTRQASISLVPELSDAIAEMRASLSADDFDRLVAEGAAQPTGQAVIYAQRLIRRTRGELVAGSLV